MIIHKFGGGILKTPEAVRQLLSILQTGPLPAVVVVSALNKMTNAFEGVARAWFNHENTEPDLQMIRGYHFDMACRLLSDPDESWLRYMKPMFSEIQSKLLEEPGKVFDRAYDQIVCYGELLSTALLRTYFEENELEHRFLDARTVIRTDDVYRHQREADHPGLRLKGIDQRPLNETDDHHDTGKDQSAQLPVVHEKKS